MTNDLLSYIREIQELIDSEFGVQEIPDVWHTFEFTEDEILLIFFALKDYLARMTTQGGSILASKTIYGLIDRLMPQAHQFTRNKIDAMNKVRPEHQEDEWEEHNRNYNEDIRRSIESSSFKKDFS